MTLIEFLLARIAEAEVAARAATPGPWTVQIEYEPWDWANVATPEMLIAGCADGCNSTVMTIADATHIARHDPARVLAECAAKRRIVELHEPRDSYTREGGAEYGMEILVGEQCVIDDDDYPCGTLRALMLPLADHPDFDPVWRTP